MFPETNSRGIDCDDREAVLLASLLWKKDWKRQSQLVRKWGEHCTENAEAALAARWLVPLLFLSSNITDMRFQALPVPVPRHQPKNRRS